MVTAHPIDTTLQDFTGYVYCPPEWDQSRLTTGPESQAIVQVFCTFKINKSGNGRLG